jgi:hypothetical protein
MKTRITNNIDKYFNGELTANNFIYRYISKALTVNQEKVIVGILQSSKDNGNDKSCISDICDYINSHN